MSAIEEQVIEKIRQRAEAGLKKYGVTVERTDLTFDQWLVHAQEEAMDLAVYLQRIIEERKAQAAVRLSCSSCAHWNMTINGGEWKKGQCRRNAPIVPTEKLPKGFDTVEWPRTDGEYWCGQWRAK